MSIGRAVSVAVTGVEGNLVEVEADVGRGLPGMYIGGLGDAAVSEARERVRTAASNSGLHWPKTKVVVSLSPASMRKHGSAFDLAIVCAVLSATEADNQEMAARLQRTVLIGEVSLDGTVKPVDGVLAAVRAAQKADKKWVIVPEENGAEAALVDGITVGVVRSVRQLWQWAQNGTGIMEPEWPHEPVLDTSVDMADVHGQSDARFALEVAAAGGHHLLMIGSPGTGKSMLAERLPTILPPLAHWQRLETTAIHSVVGALDRGTVVATPSFVAPHHSTTTAALLGGGVNPQPGALSMAHHGVLFLDEVSFMKQHVLDALRIPLETGEVTLMRSRQSVRFPCKTQLVLAANPCSCGAAYAHDCTCSSTERAKHLRALSGPLRDRIDLHCSLAPHHAVLSAQPGESSENIRQRVIEARNRAKFRWQACGLDNISTNAEVSGSFIRREARPGDEAMALLEWKLGEGEITQRGVDKILRVAWTLADLQGSEQPTFEEVMTACEMHSAK